MAKGELVQTFNAVDLGTLECTKDLDYEGLFALTGPTDKKRIALNTKCSHFSCYNSNARTDDFPDKRISNISSTIRFRNIDWKDNTAEEVQALLSGV